MAQELTALIERRGKASMIVSDRAIVRHGSEDNGEGHRTDLERDLEVVRRDQNRMALYRAG